MSNADTSGFFPAFDREFLTGCTSFSVIGAGEIGGKGKGLALLLRRVNEVCPAGCVPGFAIDVPRLTVVATGVFEQFLEANGLWDLALSDEPDDRIALAFQKADLPPLVSGDLRSLATEMHTPLAVRSSSLLEDALHHPFAGTYATKMIPNNAPDVATRFRRLTEAIKFVWASTFFRDAKAYMQAIGRSAREERMAVIVQEVVGRRHGDRFYPTVAGVLRTFNYYPTGPARPEDGVVSLALGLGKTIVDGGLTWTYAPAYPQHGPPYGSVRELMNNTQSDFWAVHMGPPPPYDPVNEAEHLVRASLAEAEQDGVLRLLASTYDPGSDRLVLGTGRRGPRVLTFAPLLELDDVPLARAIEFVARGFQQAVGCDVEMEFAAALGGVGGVSSLELAAAAGGAGGRTDATHRLGLLQIRPMRAMQGDVEVSDADLTSARAVVASERVLGNGVLDTLTDIVYVRPETFEAKHTPVVAAELDEINRALRAAGRNYVLIGFGRWGSSDPWLGIPVTWPQISGARVIVEATLPEMNVEASQGSHFFHNLTSFQVQYLTVHHAGPHRIDWDWLQGQAAASETVHVRHIRTAEPLLAKVDGRHNRGVVLRESS